MKDPSQSTTFGSITATHHTHHASGPLDNPGSASGTSNHISTNTGNLVPLNGGSGG